MFARAAKEAGVSMRPSSGDACELRGGAAFVNTHSPKSSTGRKFVGSGIVLEFHGGKKE